MRITIMTVCAFSLLTACSKSGNNTGSGGGGSTNNPTGNCKINVAATTGSNLTPYKSEFEYSSSGQLIKERLFENTSATWYYVYTYGSNGKNLSWEEYTASGSIHLKRTASFDTQGRINGYTQLTYGPFNVDTSYYHYAYEDGKFTGFELYGTDTTSKTIRYHSNGNMTKMEIYGSASQPVEIHSYEYSSVVNKDFDQEKEMVILSRSLPSKNKMSRHTIFSVALNKIDYDESYTYTVNASGYITQMTTQRTIPAGSPTVTAYTFKCN